MTEFQNNTGLVQAITALTITVSCFYAYHFSSRSNYFSKWGNQISNPENAEVYKFIKNKLLGFLFLGIVPYLLSGEMGKTSEHTFSTGIPENINLGFLISSGFVVIFLSAFYTAGKKSIQERIPQLRLTRWTISKVLINSVGWAFYLLAYEYLFRNLLLFTWAEAFGILPAIAVNLALYSAFHLPAGMAETIGAIVFGFILCIVSLLTGSFVMAFVLHLALSLSYEMFAIRYNPDMRFITGKKTPW